MAGRRLALLLVLLLTVSLVGCSDSGPRPDSTPNEHSYPNPPATPPEGSRARAILDSLEAAGFEVTGVVAPSSDATAGLLLETAYSAQVGGHLMALFQMAGQPELDAAIARLKSSAPASPADLSDPSNRASSYYFSENGLIVSCFIRGPHPLQGEDRRLIDELERLMGSPLTIRTRPQDG